MQIPIFEGAYTDQAGDFRTSYPINVAPVPKKTGFSDGYLRTVEGVQVVVATPGRERGGINWNGVHYRAAGSKLISISRAGVVTVLGEIGDNGLNAIFDYSFDRLAIASNQNLYYYQPTTGLTQVTDPDLGVVVAMCWMAGYFIVTDGNTIAVTELNDPYSVNPLKYGSAEASPDAIVSLFRISNQLCAVGRLTCEFYQNIGGALFPFQRIDNALIEKGAVGTYASAFFSQSFAFVGGGLNEPLSVYLAAPGGTTKIATREVEILLQEAGGETALAACLVESKIDKAHELLYIHLPSETLVFDAHATNKLGVPIWFRLSSGVDGGFPYRCREWTYVYDAWHCGDLLGQQVGVEIDAPTQFGQVVPWQFDTAFAYNEGAGAIIHMLELAHNPGVAGSDAVIYHQYSDDGKTWSQVFRTEPTKPGDMLKRATWFGMGLMNSTRVLRFRGANDTPDSFARVNIEAEALA